MCLLESSVHRHERSGSRADSWSPRVPKFALKASPVAHVVRCSKRNPNPLQKIKAIRACHLGPKSLRPCSYVSVLQPQAI